MDNAYLDVRTLEDLKLWWSDLNIGKWVKDDPRSIIELVDIKFIPYRGLREGFWYDIPNSFWKRFVFDAEKYSFDKEDKSLILRLSAKYLDKESVDFTEYMIESLEKMYDDRKTNKES